MPHYLLAASLLLGIAAGLPVLDDTSALIQREQKPYSKVCSKEEYAEFQARVKGFHERIQAKKARISDQVERKVKVYLDRGTGRGAEFLAPMLDAVEAVGKYLDDQATPVGVNIVKGIMQQIFKGPLVPQHRMIDVNKTVSEFLATWQGAHLTHIKSMLKNGFDQLNSKIDEALKDKKMRGIRAHVPKDMTSDAASDEELRRYIIAKALPVIAANSYPELDEVAQILEQQPLNQSQIPAWVQKDVLPWVAEKLPPKCSPKRLLTTAALGFGDVGSRIEKFTKGCKTAMGLVDVPDEPTRKCSTCEEIYKFNTIDAGNLNSCMSHCQGAALACIAGVTTDCLHKWTPCMKCHKRKLEQLDTCRGTQQAAPISELLGKLETAFKSGSVEKDSAGKFVDNLVDAVFSMVRKPAMAQTGSATPLM